MYSRISAVLEGNGSNLAGMAGADMMDISIPDVESAANRVKMLCSFLLQHDRSHRTGEVTGKVVGDRSAFSRSWARLSAFGRRLRPSPTTTSENFIFNALQWIDEET